jgi:hypothetical protein
LKALSKLAGVLSGPKYLAVFALSSALFGILLSFTSGIVVVGFWGISPLADPVRIGMVSAIALLFGLNAGVLLHNFDERRNAAGSTGMTAMGAFAALMASSCPLCQPFLLFSLGLGGLSALMAGLGILVGAFSMLMLTVSLGRSLDVGNAVCRASKRKEGGG